MDYLYQKIRLVYPFGRRYLAYSAMQQRLYDICFSKEYDMKFILNFFNYLAQSDEYHERKRQESYLSESADIHDLEYRMRELERGRKIFSWVAFTRQ